MYVAALCRMLGGFIQAFKGRMSEELGQIEVMKGEVLVLEN